MSALPKKPSLTRRQREIYDFLRDKILNRGYGPTVREIGLEFDIKSPNGVMCHLKALERKGLIIREQNMSRAIQLADGPQNRMSFTLLGSAVAGAAIQPSMLSDERVPFGPYFDGGDVACVRISGAGFSSLSIADGDFLIIRRDLTPQPGCRVAVLDDRHAVAICIAQDGTRHLMSAVPGSPPVSVRQTLGVITAIVRRFPLPEVKDVATTPPDAR